MLIPRVFPVLLVKNNRLINTIKFQESRYLGDPLNAIRIFNEKNVDELVVFDISPTCDPPWSLLSKISQVSSMPLTYGGHIHSSHQAEKIISLGFEKVSISSAYLNDPSLARSISESIGAQSVVITLNVIYSRIRRSYMVFSHVNPNKRFKLSKVLSELPSDCIGEIVINDCDRDGTRLGYDTQLLSIVSSRVSSALSITGGCSCISDLIEVNRLAPNVGFGVTSTFVYHGSLDAVLISYDHPFRPTNF